MADKQTKKIPDRVVIRPLSDVIYFYPTCLAAVVCGIIVSATGATSDNPGVTGIAFSLIFIFNLTIVAFDYTRLASIVIILMAVILILLSVMYPEFADVFHGLVTQPMFMNQTFYWVWAIGIAVVLVGILIKTRFDYWEIKNNELVHHHGLLGDTERWPAPNMRVTKEIKDVMEYLLCRSGRLVLIPARENRAIVLDNVPGINGVEDRMQRLLSTLRVDHADE